jgi:hypothetical protein
MSTWPLLSRLEGGQASSFYIEGWHQLKQGL